MHSNPRPLTESAFTLVCKERDGEAHRRGCSPQAAPTCTRAAKTVGTAGLRPQLTVPTLYGEVTKPQAQSSTHALSSKQCLSETPGSLSLAPPRPSGHTQMFLTRALAHRLLSRHQGIFLSAFHSLSSPDQHIPKTTHSFSLETLCTMIPWQTAPPPQKYRRFPNSQRTNDLQEV